MEYFDFYNINENGSEDVEYDIPEMPLYIRDGILSNFKDYTFKAHYHTDWEFIAVLDGKMKYSINSEIIEISKGESLFVNSNHIHFGFSDTKEDCYYICILVHPSLFCNNPYIERNYISQIISDSHPYLILKNGELTSTLIEIYNQKQKGNKNFYLEVQQYLFSLAANLYSVIDKLPKAESSHRNFSNIKQMMNFIAENYQEKIALSDIAKSANVCNNSCISIFKSFTNSTPIEYLTNYRIAKASQLLQSSDKSISEIAQDCGFSGSSYFAEMFKRTIGKTPKEFRNT
ncbi:MAG: AraC family transcriptional regulator [Clostridium sp.]|nr:AraC family transcriptional regulator [Clostridium sp.]